MKILSIESSCDETAAAVVEDGRSVLSSVVVSQVEEHKLYGGVVPEIASRRHAEAITGVVGEALAQADLNLNDLMIGRELRHDGTGVILDSSAVREMELMANKNHVYNTEVSRSYDGGYVNNDGYNNGYSYVDNYDYQQDVPNYYQDGYDRSVANGNFTRNVSNQYVSRHVAQFSPAFASDPNRVFYNQDHASYSHADEPVVVRTPDVQGTHNLSRAERLAMAENLFGNIDMGGYGGHSTDYEK